MMMQVKKHKIELLFPFLWACLFFLFFTGFLFIGIIGGSFLSHLFGWDPNSYGPVALTHAGISLLIFLILFIGSCREKCKEG